MNLFSRAIGALSPAQAPTTVRIKTPGDRYVYGDAIPFAIAHLVCFAAIWTGVYLTDVLIAVGLYVVRMFGITAGFHRYFAHRGYKTSRVFAFILAFLGQTSAQSGVLWWAGTHRHHHRYSDMEEDVHSPVRRGFWFAHLGWIFTARYRRTNHSLIPDFSKYPELRWLDRQRVLPAIILAVVVLLLAGWSGLIVLLLVDGRTLARYVFDQFPGPRVRAQALFDRRSLAQ